MTFDRLRAKSRPRNCDESDPSEFLLRHLQDVVAAAERVLNSTATDQLAALGLDPSVYGERFRRIVMLASAVHDLGKANDHFQGMVHGQRDVRTKPQGLRHEWASILVLQSLRDWLLPAVHGSDADFANVEWTVAGHHASPPATASGGAGPDIALLLGHPDFAAIVDWMRTTFSLGPQPLLSNVSLALTGSRSKVATSLDEWTRRSTRIWDRLKRTPDRRLLAAAKNCLVAADVAGSALPKARRHEESRWDWIDDSFACRPRPGDLQAVVEFRLNGKRPRGFQTAVAESTARVTFAKAGCGSGKTLAAYLWAARNHPIRRLYFCYPTTGTATEGFRDYLFDEAVGTPRVGADLFHGRSDIDFELILGVGPEAGSTAEDEARLDSLRAWKTPVVACTVDVVLGLMQNNRRGRYGWPALAQAAFVFDEIHAYDDCLFAALLRFLQDLPGLPVLLMTASLPQVREAALRELLGTLDPIPGPPDLEELPRYHRHAPSDPDPLPVVQRALDDGGKVLWVCNTVARVMEAAERAEGAGLSPRVYHSRFKYEDRVARHGEVVAAFRTDHRAASLAICSQVAEMSLDLQGCTLLVTDLAPVPSLIQRLGRLNRQAEPGSGTRPFLVVEPDGDRPHLPYESDQLSAARAWLERLPHGGMSQRNLAVAWEQATTVVPTPGGSAWLDGGPETGVRELRDGSPGISVLMETDRLRVRRSPRDLVRLILPMPIRGGWEAWPRKRGIPIAPADEILYDPLRGAAWRK